MNLDHTKETLKRHEGYRNFPYSCSAGHTTIGWGHNIDANSLPKDMAGYLSAKGTITQGMAERLLDADIKVAVDSCKALYPHFDEASDNRQDALINFVFNVGIVGARKFKQATKAINEEDWVRAAFEMKDSDWFSQVGNRATEICKVIQEG
jgi:lysozyme